MNRSVDSTEPSTCPACGSDILNVQGIHACSTCRWVVPEYR